jgi:hypothetical protein
VSGLLFVRGEWENDVSRETLFGKVAAEPDPVRVVEPAVQNGVRERGIDTPAQLAWSQMAGDIHCRDPGPITERPGRDCRDI